MKTLRKLAILSLLLLLGFWAVPLSVAEEDKVASELKKSDATETVTITVKRVLEIQSFIAQQKRQIDEAQLAMMWWHAHHEELATCVREAYAQGTPAIKCVDDPL